MQPNGYGSKHEDKDKIIFSAPKIGDPNEVPPSEADIIPVKERKTGWAALTEAMDKK